MYCGNNCIPIVEHLSTIKLNVYVYIYIDFVGSKKKIKGM